MDHYLAGAYRNGLKAQVVAFNRELAVAYTDTINELLAGYEASQVLAEVGRHERITAEVNISVSDAKDEDPAMRPVPADGDRRRRSRSGGSSPRTTRCASWW